MLEMFNLPYDGYLWREWFGGEARRLEDMVAGLGVDGLEVICGDDNGLEGFPRHLIQGWHLIFYADWLDFWRGDEAALTRKFATPEVWRGFYQADGPADMEAAFARDLERAAAVGAKYVVFHVSDVSIEEVYTFRWLHSNEEIIDAAAELINRLMAGKDYQFDLLLENLPWPGLRFDNAALTRRLLEQVEYPRKGIMLDIGHLMTTDDSLTDEQQAADYIGQRLDEHGELCRCIKGVHLHTSLSGEYVRACRAQTPPLPEGDIYRQFAESYQHILRIDEHKPCRTAALRAVLDRIAPQYLVHELAAGTPQEKAEAVLGQRRALGLVNSE
ncbi:MAG: TIM barrel protein [Firmicutes bacterium]|nr:TIM barrel protein [Bacillota bacterium]